MFFLYPITTEMDDSGLRSKISDHVLGLHKRLETDEGLLGTQIQPACTPSKAKLIVD